MDFKDTLNMPKTDFEMKGNLPQKEPKFQSQWISQEVEQKINKRNKNNNYPKFTLHDGPPYANGNLHVGHSLNKILKDIIIRYKTMNGFYSKYVAGWDTHGMPIEVALTKTGKNKEPNLSIIEKRKNCEQFALDWVEKQKQQFIRLGTLSNFSEIYRTLDHSFEINQLKLFNKMIKDNLIYQDLKPIYWSWSSKTALADAEVEYHDSESDSIYLSFEVIESSKLKKGDKLLIWTTTPWTIPSNKAVAVHPDFEYSRIKSGNETYVVLSNNAKSLFENIGLKFDEVLDTFKGSEIENTLYNHPLYGMNNKVILATYVSDEDGTGLVHNAPGFGHDDYLACKKYGIEIFSPIDESGKFTSEVNDDELVNLFYTDANPIVIDRLKSKNLLVKHEKITHSVAHDWRTKKPLMYRATKQWFVNLSKISNKIIKSLDNVSSVQGQSIIEKIKMMVANRQEWCISRQRYWGVPIIVIYDGDGNPIFDDELQENILSILDKEGVGVWFEKPVEHFLTKKYQHLNNCSKEKDIMDVWFDSGSSHLLLQDENFNYPADLYLEGKDQFRGWFNSSLITSIAYNNFPPYKSLLTHGFTLDDKGRKMSKSLGNVIDPAKVCEEYGADILRMWVASTEYSDDVKISNDIIKQIAEIYRRIRNTLFKFILGNINDFDYSKDKSNDFSEIDKLVISKLSTLKNNIISYYDKYDFKSILKDVNNFTLELSSFYFDYIKDSLYCDGINSTKRRAIQTVLYLVLDTVLILLTPIIPHTSFECYEHFNKHNKKENIFFEEIKDINIPNVQINNDKWKEFFMLKDEVFVELEKARKDKIINKNNDAIVWYCSDSDLPFDETTIKQYLNIADFIFKKENEHKVLIKNSKYDKCERCWNLYKELHDKNNKICLRCFNEISK